MKIVKSKNEIGKDEEFLSLTGNKGDVHLSYEVSKGDYNIGHTFAKELFRVEHPLTPHLFCEDYTGKFSFSEIKKMNYILNISRERALAHNTLDKIHPYSEDFPIIERLERKEALKKAENLARKRIKEYMNNVPFKKIYIGSDNPRDEEFLKSLVA